MEPKSIQTGQLYLRTSAQLRAAGLFVVVGVLVGADTNKNTHSHTISAGPKSLRRGVQFHPLAPRKHPQQVAPSAGPQSLRRVVQFQPSPVNVPQTSRAHGRTVFHAANEISTKERHSALAKPRAGPSRNGHAATTMTIAVRNEVDQLPPRQWWLERRLLPINQ